MAGKIDAYIDCVSFFSYMAFVYLEKNKDVLLSHGVSIEYHPVFLGAINAGSGNKPPWTLKAKAIHGKFDSARAKKHFGLEKVKTPEVFPIVTLLPLRSLVFIKEIHPQKLESTFREMFVALWEQNQDISKPELCAQALQRNFSEEGVRQILDAAGGADAKQKLQENTQKALDLGAFGAPWFQVTNKHGKAEPFFGSDRFHFMWEFLGLPWNNISISPSSKL